MSTIDNDQLHASMFVKTGQTGPITQRVTSNVDFSAALTAMKNGHKAARRDWNGKGQWVERIQPLANPYFRVNDNDSTEFGTLSSFLAIKTSSNDLVPWTPSQTDLLANDWVILEGA